MDLLDGLATYLAQLELGVYDPTGQAQAGDWSIFIEHLPDAPDRAIALTLYTGSAPDGALAYDQPRLQVRVRGTTDPRVSRQRCTAIYGELHGLCTTTLPDGTDLETCFATGTPASMGQDANRRHEHVVNFDLDVQAPTRWRNTP